jgi:hypothetical protein
MIVVFFGVDEIALWHVLPTGAKLTSDNFCYNIIEALEQVVYTDGRVPGTTHHSLHFNNVPVHQNQKAQQKLDECQFGRLKHSPCSPISHHVTSLFSIIDMKRCNSCVMALWTNFKRP